MRGKLSDILDESPRVTAIRSDPHLELGEEEGGEFRGA
jgi:hypothetical protein